MAGPDLLTDLFRESTSWAREAWGAPKGFASLAAALLSRRGEDALPDFVWGFSQSFDTFGACHQMRLDPVLVRSLLRAVEARIAAAAPDARKPWEGARDLFTKLAAGTAAEGWVVVPPDAPVGPVRVVSRWELGLRGLLKRLLGR